MSIKKALGQAGQERGEANEIHVIAVLEASRQAGKLPNWITGFRRATAEEDSKGIDIVVASDVGPLFIQIKSSKTAAEQSRRKYPDYIKVVIASTAMPDNRVMRAVVDASFQLRKRFLERREA